MNPGPRSATDRGLHPHSTFAWLMFGEVVISFAMFLLTLLSLLVSQGLGMDESTLGLAFASISAGGFTSAFLGGVVADRLGPRFVSLTALAFTFVGCISVGLSSSAYVLAFGEFLIGAAIAIYGVTAYAWIHETLWERRGLFLGVYVISLVIGLVASGLAVALFLPIVPTWRTFYLIAAIAAIVPVAPLWVLLPPRVYAATPRKAIRKALGNRDVMRISSQQFLTGVYASSYSWMPLFLIQSRGYDIPSAALLLVGSAGTWGLGSLVFGRLADRGWALPTIATGCFGSGLVYLLFVTVSGPVVTVATVLLFSLLWPAAANVPLTYLGHVLGPTVQRTEVGVMENLFLVGDGVGASGVGYIAATWTLPVAMLVVPSIAILLAGTLFAASYGVSRAVGEPHPHESP